MSKALIMLKPDGVGLHLDVELEDLLRVSGLRVVERKKVRLTEQTIRKLYGKYQERWFFDELIVYLTSDNCLLYICEGKDAFRKVKEICGNSYDGTGIRGKYSSHRLEDPSGRVVLMKNVVHVSDSCDFNREYELLKA
ncbi:MAG: nucleoside-diphosphate kinase [Patescibacteria group bacterium]